MPARFVPIVLLIGSNLFMTTAWSGHLRFKDGFAALYLGQPLGWNQGIGSALIAAGAFLVFRS